MDSILFTDSPSDLPSKSMNDREHLEGEGERGGEGEGGRGREGRVGEGRGGEGKGGERKGREGGEGRIIGGYKHTYVHVVIVYTNIHVCICTYTCMQYYACEVYIFANLMDTDLF